MKTDDTKLPEQYIVEEDEIDLRPYIAMLLRRWKLIIGITVIAAAVAGGVSLATPLQYEAISTIAIADFGQKPVPEAKAYLELATRQGVLAELAKNQEGEGQPVPDLASLKDSLKATAGSDPSLVDLKVVHGAPEQAAKIANTWAELFVRAANDTFNPTRDSYERLEGQLRQLRQQLSEAEKELGDVEYRTRVDLLQVELASQRNTLAGIYAGKTSLQIAQENAASIIKRLQQLPPTTPANPSDDSAIMMIQAVILGASVQVQLSTGSDPNDRPLVTGGQGLPVQLQIPEVRDRTVATQVASLEGIQAMIRDRTEEADRRIESLQPAILDLQVKVSQAEAERGPLLARRDSLRQAVNKLEMESSQAKAAFEAQTGQVHLVAAAQAPVAPIARGTTRNVAVATMLGLMLGVAVAFLMEFVAARRELKTGKPLHAG